ncbi:MAG: anaerobic ribonucleoside-triphosphate reductase activating protein [Ruminococcaceae bacterium]|nr:anaerobic ribonucleoside-triphosphate reductase activating protein [Oscillospiraceae bacterium]
MNIQFIQKLTLLDYPCKVACTVFLHGCNLRCPFCHNAGLVTRPPEAGVSPEELISLLKKRQGILEGVAVTGGEPLLDDGIFDLLRSIKELGYPVKLDTNGFFPDKLERVIKDGLCDYVAMDIKNCEEKYAETCGLRSVDMDAVKQSIAILEKSGIEHEFRTTVVRNFHNRESLLGAAKLIAGTEHYYLQAYKDSGDTIGGACEGYSENELKALCEAVSAVIPSVELRGM